MNTRVTRADVAKEAGVSEATVSRSLNDSKLISKGTREKVRIAAEKLRYVPNRQASSFAQQKTFRLGFVVPNYEKSGPFRSSYFPFLLNGMVAAAEKRDYSVNIILDRNEKGLKDLSESVIRRDVDGLIFGITKINDIQIEELTRKDIPFVLINSKKADAYCILNDPYKGMEQAMASLKKQGHERIGYISGDMNYTDGIMRLEAFNKLVKKFGFEYQIKEGNFSKRSGYYCAGALLNQGNHPTAIVCSSDREAVGVLEYCWDHKIQVPEKISVIGYDNTEMTDNVYPTLSSVHHPIMDMGNTAANLLMDMLEKKESKPRFIYAETSFVERESSGNVFREKEAV